MSYIPYFSLLCLMLSRTALANTRFQDGVLGFGVGTLLAYVLADVISRIFFDTLLERKPEEPDVLTLFPNR